MKKCCKSVAKTVAKAPAAPAKKAVTFTYVGAPGRTVALAGCFNNWTTDKLMTDKKGNGEYTCRVMLEPGDYQYKFVVDGEWCLDSANPRFTPNEFGSLNSVLTVPAK